MQIGMIGLGKMGSNMVRRLVRGGCQCIVYDIDPGAAASLVCEGVTGAASLDELVSRLMPPRTVWLMVPASAVDAVLAELVGRIQAGDIVIDGGNSNYRDTIGRGQRLAQAGVDYVDVGTSGGVWGLERGYCLMVGGRDSAVARLEPVFGTLAPGGADAAKAVSQAPQPSSAAVGAVVNDPAAGELGTAPLGYLHCGPTGAGHFVKMVHNGIEYGMMAAIAEGFNLLCAAGVTPSSQRTCRIDAEQSSPGFRITVDLPRIAELWRHGSIVSSWLLDLAAAALAREPDLKSCTSRVADSGEGRWMLETAIEVAVPTPVLAAALFQRFSSRGADEFATRLLAALRREFGGHAMMLTANE